MQEVKGNSAEGSSRRAPDRRGSERQEESCTMVGLSAIGDAPPEGSIAQLFAMYLPASVELNATSLPPAETRGLTQSDSNGWDVLLRAW